MSVIQIRDVPDATADRLKDRAQRRGQSLSEFLRIELERIARQPTLDEMLERIASRAPVAGEPAAAVMREERARRT